MSAPVPAEEPIWSHGTDDGWFVLTTRARENGLRFGGWMTQVFLPDPDGDWPDPEIDWLHADRTEAALGFAMACAALDDGWRGGELPGISVDVHLVATDAED